MLHQLTGGRKGDFIFYVVELSKNYLRTTEILHIVVCSPIILVFYKRYEHAKLLFTGWSICCTIYIFSTSCHKVLLIQISMKWYNIFYYCFIILIMKNLFHYICNNLLILENVKISERVLNDYRFCVLNYLKFYSLYTLTITNYKV